MATNSRDLILQMLVQNVRVGRPVVPLLGAGISIDAGVPPLSEVTRYLAKTKAYLRQRVFRSQSPIHEIPIMAEVSPSNELEKALQGRGDLPAFDRRPRDFLREFGWPDPNELNSNLWHWLWRNPPPFGSGFPNALSRLVDAEILESLSRIDGDFVRRLRLLAQLTEKFRERNSEDFREAFEDLSHSQMVPNFSSWDLKGSYWKILLTQLTRSSPDLVDTLFQRLTRRREASTAHRFFAFLTPVLRLRLFLTINFDTLLEDALSVEGFAPTIYEVADGLSLPHPKLVEEGLSVVKLHGGAYGLLVGDKLDSPLDEETRERIKAYLPDHPILLVMGIGGWDQRVLDMVELAKQRNGDVIWLYFEDTPPDPIKERFIDKKDKTVWFHAERVQDPGAFLRELYSEYKHTHPSSSKPFQACHLRPVLLEGSTGPAVPKELASLDVVFNAAREYSSPDGRLIVFLDEPNDCGLGVSYSLMKFVAAKAKSHLPVWIDIETKTTVEDVVVDIIQQLRRYDPGLPPEILAIERHNDPDPRKVVRRLYAALARGRYIVAFNAVCSFGRPALSHHLEDGERKGKAESQGDNELENFLKELYANVEPERPQLGEEPQTLGLLDSILCFAVDSPAGKPSKAGEALTKQIGPGTKSIEDHIANAEKAERSLNAFLKSQLEGTLKGPNRDYVHFLLSTFRYRRSSVALHILIGKYASLPPREDAETPNVSREIQSLVEKRILWRLEGGDYSMGRKVRNATYERVVASTWNTDHEISIEALAKLTFAHRDLAEYYHRFLYVGSQDVTSLLEAIFHRVWSLRFLHELEARVAKTPLISSVLRKVVEALDAPINQGEGSVEAASPLLMPPLFKGDGNRLAGAALFQRRLRDLLSLHQLIEEERETLLARVPSRTLLGWLAELLIHKEIIADTLGDESAWGLAMENVSVDLGLTLKDLKIEIFKDRLNVKGILRECYNLPGPINANDDSWDFLLDQEIIANLERGNEKDGSKEKRNLIDELHHIAWALRRGNYETISQQDRALNQAAEHEHKIAKFLDSWTPAEGPPPPELLELHIVRLRLAADQALWGKSPWEDRSGRNLALASDHKKAAANALRDAGQALAILDSICGKDEKVSRSYLYSLKGRALYLRGDAASAYREFDLARAGLSEANGAEREVLAVALLRQAECLMLHAGKALNSWLCDLLKDCVLKKESMDSRLDKVASSGAKSNSRNPKSDPNETQAWLRTLSPAAFRSCDSLSNPAIPHIEGLLRQSLSNCDPKLLKIIESVARMQNEDHGRLTDTLGAMRLRLAAARDLLDRVEGLLEHSRRKIEWWSCLFQLRSQLAVERLLLLLSGDFSPLSSYVRPKELKVTDAALPETRFAAWSPVRALLLRKDSSLEGVAMVHTNGFQQQPDLRRQFINRFQDLLRQGLMAIRQGLDIVLPSEEDRKRKGLTHNVLLNRFLRSWTELMICGAYATEMTSQLSVTNRWEQWLYLNRLSGLVNLPKSAESISQEIRDANPNLPEMKPTNYMRSWFMLRDWTIEPPSLAARSRILSSMEVCLDENGGGALGRLHLALGYFQPSEKDLKNQVAE